MNGLLFILLAILRMVLVLNSPQDLWPMLSWLYQIYISTKSKLRSFISITWQAISQVCRQGPTCFECVSEYAFMLVFTLMCTMLKAALQIVWLPVVGLLWWFNFYKNLINDPIGRPLHEIFNSPESGYDKSMDNKQPKQLVKRQKDDKPVFMAPLFPLKNNSKRRHPRPFRRLFPGTKPSTCLPTCFLPINH